MSIQDSKKAIHDPIAAAQRYVNSKEVCRDRHEAFVCVSVNGKDDYGVRTVFVNVSDGNVEIIIENLHTLCPHNTNRFTPDTDDISVIDKTLQIRPRTSLCGLNVIEITAK